MTRPGCGDAGRKQLMVGLLGLMVGSAVLLGWLGSAAQTCVLYGDMKRVFPSGLFDVTGPLSETVTCLSEHGQSAGTWVLISPLIADDLFAIGYGGGIGLLIWRASAAAARLGWAGWSVAALRLSALSYPIGGIFDLVENQMIIAALLMEPPDTRFVTIVARAAAVPKYGLAFIVGPLLLATGGLAGLLRRSCHLQ